MSARVATSKAGPNTVAPGDIFSRAATNTAPGGGQTGAVLLNRRLIRPGTDNNRGFHTTNYSALRSYEDILGLTSGGADGLGHIGFAAAPGLVPFGPTCSTPNRGPEVGALTRVATELGRPSRVGNVTRAGARQGPHLRRDLPAAPPGRAERARWERNARRRAPGALTSGATCPQPPPGRAEAGEVGNVTRAGARQGPHLRSDLPAAPARDSD